MISITNRQLDNYGIDEQGIFWISQGILDRDSVRESRDEELVLDIVLDMVLEPIATTGSEYRNAAYGRGGSQSATAAELVEPKFQVTGVEALYDQFFAVKGVIDSVIEASGKTWAELTITQQNPRGVPRYFQAIFIGLHRLVNVQHMQLADLNGLVRELTGFWDRDLSVPGGGGNWGRNRKDPLFNNVKSNLAPYFRPSSDPAEQRRMVVAAEFESRLQMALTETGLFELKQGFCVLDHEARLDMTSLDKVLRTASAMANTGPGSVGFVFFGVADDAADAKRVTDIHGVVPLDVGAFFISGTAHELRRLGRSVDEHLRWLSAHIRNSKLNSAFGEDLINSLAPFEYRDRLVWSITVKAQDRPVEYDQKFFRRSGPETLEIQGQDLGGLFARFRWRRRGCA